MAAKTRFRRFCLFWSPSGSLRAHPVEALAQVLDTGKESRQQEQHNQGAEGEAEAQVPEAAIKDGEGEERE